MIDQIMGAVFFLIFIGIIVGPFVALAYVLRCQEPGCTMHTRWPGDTH